MNEHESDVLQAARQDYQQQNGIMNQVYSKGASQYILSIPGIENAFTRTGWIFSCMDERTPRGNVRLPGSGILYEDKKFMKMLRQVLEQALADGEDLILTSHENCGAGKIKALQLGRAASEGDEIAYKMISEYVAKLGPRAKHIHFKSGHMQGPQDRHIARVVYIDNVGNLNIALMDGQLPPGMALSRKYIPDNKTLADYTNVALGIITDKGHGFGKFISDDEPIVVIPMARNRVSAAKMTDALAPIVNELNKDMESESIIIDPVVIQV
ncbi:MAG: hypothetical protein NTU57_05170 [Candidatus Aenigmarchaeota archaeon]|nr:hypothetical protein [Candidatus Aenigmarchaeota archaeon]